MRFLKKLTRSLFGSSRSSKPKKKIKAKRVVKKKTAKKTVKKKAPKAKPKAKAKKVKKVKKAKKIAQKSKKRQPQLVKEALALIPLGEVTHYFPHVNVAVIDLKKGALQKGDKVRIHGHTTDFSQKIESLQIEHKDVDSVKRGQDFGLRVKSRVRIGDVVYKL